MAAIAEAASVERLPKAASVGFLYSPDVAVIMLVTNATTARSNSMAATTWHRHDPIAKALHVVNYYFNITGLSRRSLPRFSSTSIVLLRRTRSVLDSCPYRAASHGSRIGGSWVRTQVQSDLLFFFLTRLEDPEDMTRMRILTRQNDAILNRY